MLCLYRNNVLVLLNGKGPALQAWVPVLLHLDIFQRELIKLSDKRGMRCSSGQYLTEKRVHVNMQDRPGHRYRYMQAFAACLSYHKLITSEPVRRDSVGRLILCHRPPRSPVNSLAVCWCRGDHQASSRSHGHPVHAPLVQEMNRHFGFALQILASRNCTRLLLALVCCVYSILTSAQTPLHGIDRVCDTMHRASRYVEDAVADSVGCASILAM